MLLKKSDPLNIPTQLNEWYYYILEKTNHSYTI
jgi:hypothetical protein